MDEMIAEALKKIKEGNLVEVLISLEKANNENPKNCDLFWRLINCYLQDNSLETFPTYITLYTEWLKIFRNKGGDPEIIPHLETLLQIFSYFKTPEQPSAEFIESLQWIHTLALSETLPNDRLRVNLALNRGLMVLYSRTQKNQQAIAIFERLAAFKDQLGWRELYSAGASYVCLFANAEAGQKKPDYLTQAIALYEQGFAKNPQSEANYYQSCIIAYLFLKNYNKAFTLLIKLCPKLQEQDRQDYLLHIMQPHLLENFYGMMQSVDPSPHAIVLGHLCLTAKIRSLPNRDDRSDAIQETHQLIDHVLPISPSSLNLYMYKTTLLDLEMKFREAAEAALQAFAHANNILADNLILNADNLIDTLLNLNCTYISAVKKIIQAETMTNNEAFQLAYAIHFISQNLGEQTLQIDYKTVSTGNDVLNTVIEDEKLAAKIQAIYPLAKEVYNLRQKRVQCWNEQENNDRQRVNTYNHHTRLINAQFILYNLKELCEKYMLWQHSLFALTARHVQEKDLTTCPAEVQERAKQSFFRPFIWDDKLSTAKNLHHEAMNG